MKTLLQSIRAQPRKAPLSHSAEASGKHWSIDRKESTGAARRRRSPIGRNEIDLQVEADGRAESRRRSIPRIPTTRRGEATGSASSRRRPGGGRDVGQGHGPSYPQRTATVGELRLFPIRPCLPMCARDESFASFERRLRLANANFLFKSVFRLIQSRNTRPRLVIGWTGVCEKKNWIFSQNLVIDVY